MVLGVLYQRTLIAYQAAPLFICDTPVAECIHTQRELIACLCRKPDVLDYVVNKKLTGLSRTLSQSPDTGSYHVSEIPHPHSSF